jgi:hypothetical protein
MIEGVSTAAVSVTENDTVCQYIAEYNAGIVVWGGVATAVNQTEHDSAHAGMKAHSCCHRRVKRQKPGPTTALGQSEAAWGDLPCWDVATCLLC